MHPKAKMQQDLKAAMKAKDTQRREVLRLLLAAFKQAEVDEQKQLSAEDATGILMREAKKRRDAIVEMEQAGRTELVDQEQYELTVIEDYLPKQLSEDELADLVRAAIDEVGATTPRDMGQVMKVLMPRVKGQADGKVVSAMVQKMLS